jgi:hypothetical protein
VNDDNNHPTKSNYKYKHLRGGVLKLPTLYGILKYTILVTTPKDL